MRIILLIFLNHFLCSNKKAKLSVEQLLPLLSKTETCNMHDACADADRVADVGVAEPTVRTANVTKLSKRKSRQNAKLKSRNHEINSNSTNGSMGNKRPHDAANVPLRTHKRLRLAQRIRSAPYFWWFAAGIAVCLLIGAIVISQRETLR